MFHAIKIPNNIITINTTKYVKENIYISRWLEGEIRNELIWLKCESKGKSKFDMPRPSNCSFYLLNVYQQYSE